jgi:hypothetical protein
MPVLANSAGSGRPTCSLSRTSGVSHSLWAGGAKHERDGDRHAPPGLTAIERSIADYLVAEQRIGRLPSEVDTGSVALAVVGTVHHLLMTTAQGEPHPADRIRALVTMLTARSS